MTRSTVSSSMFQGRQRWIHLSVALALVIGVLVGLARPAAAADPVVNISATVKKTISIELMNTNGSGNGNGNGNENGGLTMSFGQVSADGSVAGASQGVQAFTQNGSGYYFTPQIKVKVTSNSNWQAYMSASMSGIDNSTLKLAWTTQAPSGQGGESAAPVTNQTQLANGPRTPQQGTEVPHYLVLQVAWGAPAGQQISGTVTYTATAN